jgi:hypothetical protein
VTAVDKSLNQTWPNRYIDIFQEFWSTKDPQPVADILADDAVASWSGLPDVSGRDYAALLCRTTTVLIPDMSLTTVSHAETVDEVFIRWEASGTVNGRYRTWRGIDHVQFRGPKVARIDAIFDTAALA